MKVVCVSVHIANFEGCLTYLVDWRRVKSRLMNLPLDLPVELLDCSWSLDAEVADILCLIFCAQNMCLFRR